MIIRNAVVVGLGDATVRPNVTVRVKDGIITAVEEDGSPASDDGTAPETGHRSSRTDSDPGADTAHGAGTDPGAGTVIDAGGAYLIPGLVNMHAHTAMAPLRGTAEDLRPEAWFNERIWIYEQNLTPDDVYWGTLLGALEMLSCGVTAVADHYFHMDRAFSAFRDAGIRANLAQAVFGFGDHKETLLEQAVAFARDYREADDRISVSMGPHSPYLCPDDFLQQVVSHARRLDVPVHIHVSETAAQVEESVSQHGKTPVEVLADTGVLEGPAILAHAYHGTDTDFERLARSQATVAHCPKTYMRFGDAVNFLPRALEAQVDVCLATDGAASNSTMDLFEAARHAALLAKTAAGSAETATVPEVLPLLTAGGRALGLPNYGEIREGAAADMVLVQPSSPAMNPGFSPAADLLYSVSRDNIDTVIVDGEVLVRGGRHLRVDEKEVFARNRELVARVARRTSDRPMQTFRG